MSAEKISRRLVLRMASEAFDVLAEGTAERESDVDAALVSGTGFPDFRGGVLRDARDVGIDAVAARLEALAQRCGDRYRPCAVNL